MLEMVCRAEHINCDDASDVSIQSLSTSWRQRHFGVLERIPTEPISPEAPKMKPCFAAGHCTCGAHNASLRQFLKKLELQLKAAYPTNSKIDVAKLVNAQVVMVLCTPQHGDSEAMAVFAFLAVTYLRPFKACVVRMRHVPLARRQFDPAEEDILRRFLVGEPLAPDSYLTLEMEVDDMLATPAVATLP